MKEEDIRKKIEASSYNIGKALLQEGKDIKIKSEWTKILIIVDKKEFLKINYEIIDPDQTILIPKEQPKKQK